MSFPQFGEIIETAPESFEQFGEVIEPVSRTRSLIGAPIKGAIKEAANIGELFQKIPLPKGEFNPEKARQFAEEKLPTHEKELESYLERAGGLLPTALVSPGGPLGKLVQILGGAALGYGAEKLGAPEWAQAVAESAPFFFSGGKKIPLKSSQRKLGDFLRKEGLTENEIAPLLKTPEQLERWSKYAEKGAKSRQLMESIYQKSGHIYDNIETAAKSLPDQFLSAEAAKNFLTEMTPIVEKMPFEYRKLIKQDMLDFLKGGGQFNDLTNLYKDINAVVGAEHGGRAIVGQFKEPILKAMESISPELADDFRLATDLYRTRANVAGKILSKQQIDHMFDAGEIAAIGAGIYNRDIGLIGKVIGLAGARKLAREMLINPRLQNISVRIGEALKKNKFSIAEKYMTEFKDEIAKDDPELANSIP